MMKAIKLTQGKYAIVDDKDYEYLNQYKWHANFDGYNWYAARANHTAGKCQTIYMHRQILQLSYDDGKHTDHINHDGLDNRSCNIRIVTNQKNHFNRRNIKGYTWHEATKKWQSQIGFNGKKHYLGLFGNENDAHKAYLQAKQKYHKIDVGVK